MNPTGKFRQEWWSLHVSFDPIEQQYRDIMYHGGHALGELAALESHILETFGGLPEEYAEIVRPTGEGSIEITCDIIDWLQTIVNWIIGHTTPRELRLVRNGERQ